MFYGWGNHWLILMCTFIVMCFWIVYNWIEYNSQIQQFMSIQIQHRNTKKYERPDCRIVHLKGSGREEEGKKKNISQPYPYRGYGGTVGVVRQQLWHVDDNRKMIVYTNNYVRRSLLRIQALNRYPGLPEEGCVARKTLEIELQCYSFIHNDGNAYTHVLLGKQNEQSSLCLAKTCSV